MSQAMAGRPTIRIRPGRHRLDQLLVAKVVYGAALMGVAAAAPSRVAQRGFDRRVRMVAGAIGARDLVEAAVLAKRPTATTMGAAAAIDLTHSASMVVVAITQPARRRLAIGSAVAAGLFAGVAMRTALRSRGSNQSGH